MKLGLIRQCGILCIASAIALSGCSSGSKADQQQSQGEAKGQRGGERGAGKGQGGAGGRGGGGRGPALQVRTTPVEHISFQRQVNLSGTLLSQDQVRVSSEVDGVIRDVLVEIGQEVRAGQVIVQIEPRELQFALDRAESALRQTEAQLGIDGSGKLPPDEQIAAVQTAMANRDDAKAQLARAQELSSKGLMSRADLDTAQTRVKVTDAQYQTALENARSTKASLQDRRAAYELAKKKLADAQIRAPVSGAISDRPAQRGEFIRANTIVATIVQLSPLKLKSAVQEKYASLIKSGMNVKFNVESYPDETFNGTIRFINPSIDQTTRTFSVEVLVDNSTRKLRPGFFAQGAILTKKDDNVMAVPEDAVAMLAGVASVYVVDKGQIKQTNIQIGEREGKYLEVTGGLTGSEVLAASNLNQLVSGMQVSTGGGRGRGQATESVSDPENGPAGETAPAGGGKTEGQGGGRRGGGRGNRGQRGSDQGGGSQ